MKKRIISVLLAATMCFTIVGCGNNNGQVAQGTLEVTGAGSTETASETGAADTEGVSITILNSKSEVQSQFEEMAAAYSEATGVNIEVYCADTDTTVASQVATRYASNDPYTITMVDPKDIYALADDYAYDLSGEDWASHTDLGITVNDRLVGFPVCVEARGIMYNADAIEAITGQTFDPASIDSLDDFQRLLEELKAGGMEQPVGIMSEFWSLGAHYFAEVYEQQEDPEAFVNSLLAGEEDLGANEKYNSLMDAFDTLKAYNYMIGAASNAERETSEMMLAEGQIAFMFGGNWDWSEINQYDYTENMGIMPIPQNMDDGSNNAIVGGATKYVFVDASDATSEAERQAALDFLNWIVFDPAGNAFLTEQCALVPAFDNIDASALDPLSASVKAYADAGNLIPSYNYLPDDHMTVVGQEIMQKYLDNAITRDELTTAVIEYFKTATPIQH